MHNNLTMVQVPMTKASHGNKQRPDIFQAAIHDILGDLDCVRVHTDNILITSDGTHEDHMAKLKEVSKRLQHKTRTSVLTFANVFAKNELEHPGHWLTREELQPQPKKVEATQRLQPPRNARQLRRFLGMANFHGDMWRRRSHVLAPLSKLVGENTKWKWGTEQQEAFDDTKAVMSRRDIAGTPRL